MNRLVSVKHIMLSTTPRPQAFTILFTCTWVSVQIFSGILILYLRLLFFFYLQCNLQVKEFVQSISGSNSFYGLQEDTIDSLALTVLPPFGHEYCPAEKSNMANNTLEIEQHILQQLLLHLRTCLFNITESVSFTKCKHNYDNVNSQHSDRRLKEMCRELGITICKHNFK